MAAEVMTKKRGRPKKMVETPADRASGADDVPSITTSKRSTKSRSLSTTDIKAATPKKLTRRKQTVAVDDAPPAELETEKASKPSKSVMKSKASKSTILDEATAFAKLKEDSRSSVVPERIKHHKQQSVVADNGTQSGTAEQVLEALQLKSAPASPTPTPTDMTDSTKAEAKSATCKAVKGESVIQPRKPASESSEEILEALQLDPESAPVQTTQASQRTGQKATPTKPAIADQIPDQGQAQAAQSSFLSSFLDDKFQEAAPTASEDDKISDRSAFNAPKLSAQDIVAGVGVSTLSSFRDSAPGQRRAPKVFKAHTLSAFEHGPHESLHPRQRTTVKQVEPETFAAGSFKAFKVAKQTATTTTDGHPQADKPFFTQATSSVLPAQASVVDQPAPPPRAPPQPQSQSQSQPLSQPSAAQPRAKAQPVQSAQPISSLRPDAPASQPEPVLPPKKPTEMSYVELKRNQDFKSLRRRWTGLIVGVPVLVVTSYVLWHRLNVADQLESMRADRAGEGRERGIVPAPRRILDDGALDKEGR